MYFLLLFTEVLIGSASAISNFKWHAHEQGIYILACTVWNSEDVGSNFQCIHIPNDVIWKMHYSQSRCNCSRHGHT